jgi:hypothetical protein
MDYVKIGSEVIATILCLIGVIFVTIPRRIGLWFLIFGQITWILFSILNNHWFMMSQMIFLTILDLIALKTWKTARIRF